MDETAETILELAKTASLAAAEVLLRYLGAARVSHKEGQTQNLVTQADVEAEAAILAVIRATFPAHDVLLEEGQSTGSATSEHLWIVDPLDGTTNYAHGIPQFCSALAYATRGQVQVGVVYDPMRNELFHATRGGGAYLNGTRIHVSQRSALTEAIVATGFYYDRGAMMQRTLAAIQGLFEQNILGIRRFGGAAIDQCWVACGRFDGFFEYQLSPWDYAAGALIVEEAGGRTSDRSGNPLQIDSGHVLVSNHHLFDGIFQVVRW